MISHEQFHELPPPPAEIEVHGHDPEPEFHDEEGGQIAAYHWSDYHEDNPIAYSDHNDRVIHGDRQIVPPPDYYKQSGEQQMVLPGMEMSPQEHVEALGKKHGMTGTLESTEGVNHSITLRTSRTVQPDAYLDWTPHQSHQKWMKSGEIQMVHVDEEHRKKGIASDMLATAEKISREHPEISDPRHSTTRSRAGMAFSRAEMKKRGQVVW